MWNCVMPTFNPQNKPIVAWENSWSKLRNEIAEEGKEAYLNDKGKESCPYSKGSTFYREWIKGYNVEKYN